VHGLVNVNPWPAGEDKLCERELWHAWARYRTTLALDEARCPPSACRWQHDTGWRDNTGGRQQKLSCCRSVLILRSVELWTPWLSGSRTSTGSAGFLAGRTVTRTGDLVDDEPETREAHSAMPGSARIGARQKRELGAGPPAGAPRPMPHHSGKIESFRSIFLPNGGVEKTTATRAWRDGPLMAGRRATLLALAHLARMWMRRAGSNRSRKSSRTRSAFFPRDAALPRRAASLWTTPSTRTTLALWAEAICLGLTMSALLAGTCAGRTGGKISGGGTMTILRTRLSVSNGRVQRPRRPQRQFRTC